MSPVRGVLQYAAHEHLTRHTVLRRQRSVAAGALLGRRSAPGHRGEADGELSLVPTDGNPFQILFVAVPESKTEKNRLHLDVAPPADGDRDSEVERLVALGARRIDIGQGDVSWVVLADPEGNGFCVLTPR
jgi:hypothetical protein